MIVEESWTVSRHWLAWEVIFVHQVRDQNGGRSWARVEATYWRRSRAEQHAARRRAGATIVRVGMSGPKFLVGGWPAPTRSAEAITHPEDPHSRA